MRREHSARAATKGLCFAASEFQITILMFSWWESFLSKYFSPVVNQSPPLPWKFFILSGVKSLRTSAAMRAKKKKKKEEKTTAYRVCLFVSFNRLQIQVWYDTLTFLWFNISLTQYWLLFERLIGIISWSSQMWTNYKMILLSRDLSNLNNSDV